MASAAPYIRSRARRYGLDPRAVLAIGRVEGGLRRYAVGDQGTSFGPFQLHRGGALPRGKGAAWAGSNAGIDYALRGMSGVAKGLTGRAAVEAISRRFERPADPGAEIRKAMAFYGSSSGAMAAVPNNPTGEFKAGPQAAGTPPKQAVTDFMMQNLASFRATGSTPELNNFYALSQMISENASPDLNVETPPPSGTPRRALTGQGAANVAVGKGFLDPLHGAGTYEGGIAAHMSRPLGNWQSDRAVDIRAKAGTPVYASRAGVIRGGFGDSGTTGTVYGKRLNLYSPHNAFFYQHLGRYGPGIRPGAHVRKGQVLGYVGYFPGKPAPHLHFGVERGNPRGILTGRRR